MKGIIILDGPDACGKTTLANKFIEKYGGTYIHLTYRFADKMPIYHAAMLRKALKLSKSQLVIIDRLHVSEYIYAKVFRGGTKWPWMLPMFNSLCRELNIPIIVCAPSTVKRGIEWFEETKSKRFEMYDDISKVIQEYIDYGNKHDVILYNRDFNDVPFENGDSEITYFDTIDLQVRCKLGA